MSGFVSIDQNCTSLWDCIPKLACLAAHGKVGRHFIEDVDVAFTLRGGAALPPDAPPDLARERFYRGGVSDWGAALFYTDLLGRNPLDIQELAPFTGWSTAALSRRLGFDMDEMYAEFSTSDNHQMVGPSYTADSHYHRTIADIRVDEVVAPLRRLWDHARSDCLERVPERAARDRTNRWFEAERGRVDAWLDECAGGRLPDLYERWMKHHCPHTPIKRTSELFALTERSGGRGTVLGEFLRNYEATAGLYNQAIEDTQSSQYPLELAQGDLPFAVILERGGRWLRGNLRLHEGRLHAEADAWPLGADASLPVSRMWDDGVRAVVGKALVLVLQVRAGVGGAPLALPNHGSQYMPTAGRFEELLASESAAAQEVQPVWRIKVGFPEQLAGCGTMVRLPGYLQRAFGAVELPADELARRFRDVRARATADLHQARTENGRQVLLGQWAPDLVRRRDELNNRRRELGRNPETRAQAGDLWEDVKALDAQILRVLAERLVETLHVSRLDFWDSRGALLPWAVALGGEKLYNRLIERAEIVAETYSC